LSSIRITWPSQAILLLTFMVTSRWICFRMRNISDRICREN
jgi:hypothetical protein